MKKEGKISDMPDEARQKKGREPAEGKECGERERAERREWAEQDTRAEWELAKTLAPDRERKERALEEIRREIAGKHIRLSPSRWEIVWVEFQYISPLFWVSQAGFLVLLFSFSEKIFLGGGKPEDYLQWASIAAAWLGVLLYSNLGRHLFRGMAELEQSCYFNLSQIWAIKMALAGTGDILVLSLGCGRIAGLTRMPFLQVIVYLLVPFVLSNVCCLLFFSALRGGRGRFGNLLRAFPAVLMAMVPATVPRSYEAAFWWIWLLALSAGVAVFAWQIWLMYRKIERGEVLCWN